MGGYNTGGAFGKRAKKKSLEASPLSNEFLHAGEQDEGVQYGGRMSILDWVGKFGKMLPTNLNIGFGTMRDYTRGIGSKKQATNWGSGGWAKAGDPREADDMKAVTLSPFVEPTIHVVLHRKFSLREGRKIKIKLKNEWMWFKCVKPRHWHRQA